MINSEKTSKLPSAIANMKTVQEVHEYYQKIISCMPNNIYWLDRNCITQGCNDNVLKFVGVKSLDEFIGLDYEEMAKIAGWSEGHGELYKQEDLKVMSSGIPLLNVEDPPIHDENGEPVYYLTSRVPVFDDKTHEVIGVVGISVDITDRKKMEESRRLAQEKAEAGERTKTEFIANVTHDLRTPLTGIIGVSEYLIETMKSEEDKKNVEIILSGGKQLLALLNDVLENLSADTTEENQAVCKPFDLHAVIDDLCELERPAIFSHHLDFHLSVDKEIPRYLIGDKIKLHRILLNLIGNGIKFTEKGSISLSLQLLEKKDDKAVVEFSVTDTGIGIPAESQEQVFDRFYKVSASYKGKFKGNGIGLHIVQKYTNLLGGKINLQSKVGEGTTFSIILTLPIGDSVDNSHDEDYIALLKEEKQLIDGPTSIESEKLKKTELNQASQKPKILVIEDNATALNTIKLLLSRYDVEVQEAMDAEIAFELIKDQYFNLIITDIGLPGISGDELATLIRKYEKEEGINPQKIVALTGHAGTEEFALQCRRAGIDKVYKKPMMMSDLKDLVTPLISTVENQENTQSKERPKNVGKLGVDLPDTEEELFELNHLPIFDLQVGAKVMGSEEVARELHQDFKNQTLGEDLGRLKQAHGNGDWVEIEKLSHKIKGGSCYGTVRLYYALLYMERYLKAGHKNCSEKLYDQMIRVIDETTEYLDKNL